MLKRQTKLYRIAVFRDQQRELARAIYDGAKVHAYHAWSLIDNFISGKKWEGTKLLPQIRACSHY